MIYFLYWFIVVVTCMSWGIQLVQMSVVKDTARKVGYCISIAISMIIVLPFYIMVYPALQYVQ